MTEPVRVELELDRNGLGSLRVDGVELAPIVTRAVITCVAGAVPVVELYVIPGRVTAGVDGRLELVDE